MTVRRADASSSAATARPSAVAVASSPETVGSYAGSLAQSARRVIARPKINKILRYALTSGVTTGISEVTLLVLYASGFLGATGSSVIANLAGTVPSYLLSRYWIWPEAERSGVTRQMGLYWATSFVSMVVTTVGASFAGAHAPAGHTNHVIVVGSAYIATVAVLWVAKFIVYQRIVFNSSPLGRSGAD